jgi:hypothetical protein
MKVLDFKKWYENKDSGIKSPAGAFIEELGKNIVKVPKRMLYLEMDTLSENVNTSQSKNKIDRYYLKKDASQYSDNELKTIEKILKESKDKGTFIFLTAYDFSSKDPKKTYKNSQKILEDFKSAIPFLSEVQTRAFGSLENISASYQNKIDKEFYRQRIELVECHFDPLKTGDSLEIPFYFNPNDHQVIEKYQGCLRGLMIQQILKNESFSVNVSVYKTLPNLKDPHIPNDINSHLITEMKYPDPHKSSLLFPQNKPKRLDSKITVKELTEKRANSVIEYMKKIAAGLPIKFSSDGLGYKEGNSSIIIKYS